MTGRQINTSNPPTGNSSANQVNAPSGTSSSPAAGPRVLGGNAATPSAGAATNSSVTYHPKTPQEQLDRARQINEGCWSQDGLVALAGCKHLKLGPTANLHLGVKELVQMAVDAAEAGDTQHAIAILQTGLGGCRFTPQTQFVKDNPEKNALIYGLLESVSFHPFVITSSIWDAKNFDYNNFNALQQLTFLEKLSVGNDQFTSLKGQPAGRQAHWMAAKGVGLEMDQVITLFDSFDKTVTDFDQRVDGILRERQRTLDDLGVRTHGAKRLDIDWSAVRVSKAEQVQLNGVLDQKRPFFMRYEKDNETAEVADATSKLAKELLTQLGQIRGPGVALPDITEIEAAISAKEAGFYNEFEAPAKIDCSGIGEPVGSGNVRWVAASCLEEASKIERAAKQKGIKSDSFWFDDSQSIEQLEQRANAVVTWANNKSAQGQTLDAKERDEKRRAESTLGAIGELRQTRFQLDNVLQDFGRAMFDFHEKAKPAMGFMVPPDPSLLGTYPHSFQEFQRAWSCQLHLKVKTFNDELLADLGEIDDDRLFVIPDGAPKDLIAARNRPQPGDIQRMQQQARTARQQNLTQSQKALADYYLSGRRPDRTNVHYECTVSEVKCRIPGGALARLRGVQGPAAESSLLPVDDALKLANAFSELRDLEKRAEHLLDQYKRGAEVGDPRFVSKLERVEKDLEDKQQEFGALVQTYFEVGPDVPIRSDMITFEGAANASTLIAAGQATSVVDAKVFKELQDVYNYGVSRFQQAADRTLGSTAKPIGYAANSIAKARSAANAARP